MSLLEPTGFANLSSFYQEFNPFVIPANNKVGILCRERLRLAADAMQYSTK